MNPSTMEDAETFLFPQVDSPVIPSPAPFFSPDLLSSPLPTNSFFQNFTLNNGDQPEYIHPYLIKSSNSTLTLCYPKRFHAPLFLYQTFVSDLSISTTQSSESPSIHSISSFDDLSVTLDLPPSLRAFLVRGSPYVTCSTKRLTDISLHSVHAFLSVTPNSSHTKHTFELNSGQTFLCYSSTPLHLELKTTTELSSTTPFSGILRFAALLHPSHEPILDRFSPCYPISGTADLDRASHLNYHWNTQGWGELLLLAHPLHIRQLNPSTATTQIIPELTYSSIDGDLVGVVGDTWTLTADPIPTTWHSLGGVSEMGREEIVSALSSDIEALTSNPITTTSSYFYGKAVARVARLALIAEEVGCFGLIPAVAEYLKETVTVWLDGSFAGNGFLYDPKWRGIVTRQGAADRGADFGFGIYNDHHYHIGYFLYAIAVLCKLDSSWGRKYRSQAYALVGDILTLSRQPNANYARLRCFDMWKLHSWAGGLTEFADGRNQESTSEAVNAYYAAALMGLSYGDTWLALVGSTLAGLEISAAEMWWHVREGEGMYEVGFERENRVVGVLWNNKRDGGLWFAPPEWRECRLGIQVLPLLPVTELLFGDEGFVREMVQWAMVSLQREGVGEGWKGFVYAMEGVYDWECALEKVRGLLAFDDGNSLSNLLWWLYSRCGRREATSNIRLL